MFSCIKNDTNILCRLWLYHNVVMERNLGKNVNRQDWRARHTTLKFKKRENRGCYCFPNLVRLLLSQTRVEHEKCENFCPSWLCHNFTNTALLSYGKCLRCLSRWILVWKFQSPAQILFDSPHTLFLSWLRHLKEFNLCLPFEFGIVLALGFIHPQVTLSTHWHNYTDNNNGIHCNYYYYYFPFRKVFHYAKYLIWMYLDQGSFILFISLLLFPRPLCPVVLSASLVFIYARDNYEPLTQPKSR